MRDRIVGFWVGGFMLWGRHILTGVLATAVLAAIAATTLAACSPKSQESTVTSGAQTDGIIGGVDVPGNNKITRGIVAVYDSYSSQLCTGSLLEDNTVLTAAHCLGSDVTKMFIIFGIQLSGDSERRQADKMETSPEWQAQLAKNVDPVSGDIGLIHFKGDIPAGYEPATLLTNVKSLKKNAKVVLAGYGITNGDTKVGAGTLRAANVKIVDPQSGPFEVKLDQTQGQGACHGDSGGPAYIYKSGQYYLWGVTSRGSDDPKDSCTQFSIYTNALGYLDWINETTAKFAGTEKVAAPSVAVNNLISQ
jgi:secreted trypsin-like serine protease